MKLRLLADQDLAWVLDLVHQPHVEPWLCIDPLYPDENSIGAWLLKTNTNMPSRAFGIVNAEQTVGFITLNNIDPVNRCAASCFLAVQRKAPAETAKESIGALCDYAFDTLNLNRLESRVNARNRPMLAVYKRLGIHQDGVIRQCTYMNGEYQDDVLFSVLKSEWEG